MDPLPGLEDLPGIAGVRGVLRARRGPRPGGDDLLPRGRIPRHLVEALGRFRAHPVTYGNAATLYDRGREAFTAMLAAIDGARDHVNLETYTLQDDGVGGRFVDALGRAAARGVRVNLVLDAVGCWDLSSTFLAGLEERGLHLVMFNPVAPWRVRRGRWVLNHRDHRKILVVDGRTAFTGGMNIGDEYDDDGTTPGRWRDAHLRVEGPAVAFLQRTVLSSLFRKAPDTTPEADYFPVLEPRGEHAVRVLPTTPHIGRPYVRIVLRRALRAAERTVHMTQAYFMPDARVLWSLGAAARRGVDVQLVVPGRSDIPLALHAGRSTYGRLLRRGVVLHERQDRILHAKSVVVDGTWSILGSANMDIRSFRINYEVSVDVLGSDFGERMEAVFAHDRARSRPISVEEWNGRPLLRKIKERLCGLARLFV